mgnify:CR=1 FL=1
MLFRSPAQVQAAADVGAQVVELHTGLYCDLMREARDASEVLARLWRGAEAAERLGLEVHAGHGIDYGTVGPIAAIAQVAELNIGHFLIGEAIFVGLGAAIGEMRRCIDAARAELAA